MPTPASPDMLGLDSPAAMPTSLSAQLLQNFLSLARSTETTELKETRALCHDHFQRHSRAVNDKFSLVQILLFHCDDLRRRPRVHNAML